MPQPGTPCRAVGAGSVRRSPGLRRRPALAGSLLALCCGACAGTAGPDAAGSLTVERLDAGGREREYLLYRPAAATHGAAPLVIVFHGGGGTARGIAREVGRRLHPIADREGFYVAYPDAVGKMWDFGSGVVSEALEERVDDDAFFGALLDRLADTLPVDRGRVFATGISRGGQASYFVACRFPGRIRAIAPVAMPMPAFLREDCADAAATGVAIMNGTDDPLVPYDGGHITVGRKERGLVLSTDETLGFWRERNGCSETPTSETVIDRERDHTRVVRTAWDACESAAVVLYRIEGGGHTWPSGRQYLPRFIIGSVSREIDGAAEAWAFFSRFEQHRGAPGDGEP